MNSTDANGIAYWVEDSPPKRQQKRTDASGQVSTGSAATQTLPMFSRQDLGAVLKNSLTSNKKVFHPKGKKLQS